MFIDDETTKLKFVGREDITTKFELCHLWSLSRWCNQGAFFKEQRQFGFR
jgi:hypothetical protein